MGMFGRKNVFVREIDSLFKKGWYIQPSLNSEVEPMRIIDRSINNSATMVNLSSYPMVNAKSAECRAFVKKCRQQYAETRFCLLPDFFLP